MIGRLLGVVVVLAGCGSPTAATADADSGNLTNAGYPREILTRPDLQALVEAGLDRQGEPLARALTSEDALIRSTATCALASVQEPSLRSALEARLQDPDARARHCSAFAIGQLGPGEEAGTRALFAALATETNALVRTALQEAIGKVGPQQDLARLIDAMEERAPHDDLGYALALYHFGRRRITDVGAAAHLAALVGADDEQTAVTAALALGAGRGPDGWGVTASDVRALLDATPRHRRTAGPLLAVLAREADPTDVARARAWLDGARHWTVGVAAARALGAHAGADSLAAVALVRALSDTSPHVATTAAQVLAASADRLRGAIAWDVLVRAHLDRPPVAAALLPALVGTSAESLILEWARGERGPPASYAWPALARVRSRDVDALLVAGLQGSRRDAYVAAAALAQRLEAGTGDASLRGRVAHALVDRLFVWGPHAPSSDIRGVTRLLALLGSDSTPETRALRARAAQHSHPQVRASMEREQGSAGEAAPRPHAAVDWELLARAGERPALELRTARGAFVVELDPLVAPLAVSALLQHARAGRLSGLVFHRVEADFILQSGDFEHPDGYGGPARGLRSELGTMRFAPGVMGMASAGRDTEGSQYFLTHNYAPSLDGRYGAIGRIVRGQEIADAVALGDPVSVVVLP